MKLSATNNSPVTCISLLLSLPFFSIYTNGASDGHDHDHNHTSCTYGKLYVSDVVSGSSIHVIDLNHVKNLTVESTIEINGGPKANDLYVTDNNQVVASLFFGTEDLNYTDGVVNWIHTGAMVNDNGTVTYETPSVLPNAAFDCVLPLHFSSNGDKISIFCDGNYDIYSNSTIWIIDESKLNVASTGTSAIIYNTTIQSSHHGNSAPIGDSHLLYSLPTPDRIIRSENGTYDELATTFQVTDLSGTVVHSVADTSDTNTYCSGHHGIANTHDTVMLACDENHGGVLMVSYDESSKAYESRALSYPLDGYRSFHFEHHPNASHFIGDLLLYDPNAEGNPLSSLHLFAFSSGDEQLTESHAIKLPTDDYPCKFTYEKSEGEIILAFLSDGNLLAYEFKSNWTEIARLKVVANMTKCTQAVFVAGYVQAFVMTTDVDNATIYAIDLDKVRTEGMTISATSSIDFVPYSAVVAGVPPSTGCISSSSSNSNNNSSTGDSSDDEGSDDKVDNSTGTSAAAESVVVIQRNAAAIAVAAIYLAMLML